VVVLLPPVALMADRIAKTLRRTLTGSGHQGSQQQQRATKQQGSTAAKHQSKKSGKIQKKGQAAAASC